jgi:hypothetical protein
MSKPIRVFWSPLSQRFYASRAYKEDPRGFVTITGEKFDVTADIAYAILKQDITFTEAIEEEKAVEIEIPVMGTVKNAGSERK